MKLVIDGKQNGSNIQETFELSESTFSVEYIESDQGTLTIRDLTGVSSVLDNLWKALKKYDIPFTASVYFFSTPLVLSISERTLVYQKEKSKDEGDSIEILRAIKLYI